MILGPILLVISWSGLWVFNLFILWMVWLDRFPLSIWKDIGRIERYRAILHGA